MMQILPVQNFIHFVSKEGRTLDQTANLLQSVFTGLKIQSRSQIKKVKIGSSGERKKKENAFEWYFRKI